LRFDLVTRLMTWDDKYVYMEQTFERDGELCAHAYVKGLFLSREGHVPNAEVVGIIGYAGAAPVMSEALQRWAALTNFTPPGTSPRPVLPALSRSTTMLRVKYGPWAPLRLSSMLSWPATGTTRRSVTTGVAC
jgi:hypothetical protein